MSRMIYTFPVYATAQPSTSATNYTSLTNGLISWDTTESNTENVAGGPGAWLLDQFTYTVATAPGVGKQWVFTVRVNETDTAMKVTISGTNVTATYGGAAITVNPGDRVTMSSVPTGNPTATGDSTRSWRVTASGQNMQMLMTPSTLSHTIAANVSGYMTLDQRGNQTTALPATFPWAVDGVISGLYLDVTPAPAVGTVTCTLVNATTGDTVLTCTVAAGSVGAHDTTHSVSVAKGDLLYWRVDVSVLVTNGPIRPRIGALFAPTTNNQICYVCEGGCNNGGSNYTGGEVATGVNVESKNMPMPACTVSQWYIYNGIGNGTNGGTLTYMFRKNLADTAVTFQVFPTGQITGNSGTTKAVFAAGDLQNVKQSGTGSGSTGRYSFMMDFNTGGSSPFEPPMSGNMNAQMTGGFQG